MIKVIVTGCHGQVGAQLTQQLNARDDIELVTLDRDGLDITDAEQVESMLDKLRPNVIINAAAYTAVDKAEQDIDACYAVNDAAVENLALSAHRIGALMLHISTDYVFDGLSDHPYSELDKVNPQNVYGVSKLQGEQKLLATCPNSAILRTSWVFGEQGQNFVKTMLRLAASRQELSVVADQFGGPTYAGDIASALIKMMDSMLDSTDDLSGVYHFGGAPHVSWFDFSKEIFSRYESLSGKHITVNPIPSEMYPTPAKRPANSRLNCQKIEQVFSIKPSQWQSALDNIEAYLASE
ncbi:dTDP-4-dehydrorhamnose reductase [Vibrio sp. WXL103]|uniref:dTDP-4-dehydrorhamnose reductase n=1 Tax=Vibrio sp. WXL103 TaxID=3450710 RepID=UPI003EC6E599